MPTPAPDNPFPPDNRLRRYLPADLLDALADEVGGAHAGAARTQAFVHLAAARYAVSTYLPRAVVGPALGERAAAPWLRWVDGSLLFADISGSTALAERLGALGREGTEIVTDFLNTIFAAMTDVVRRHGGDLLTFGGDALLVLFDGPEHAHTAAATALALQDALHGYVRSVPGVGSFPMHLHIGVESGRVGLLSAGSARELHYSVLGQVVAGVAAAEGRAGPEEVVLGPRAWQLAGQHLRGDVDADGFARLLAADAAPAAAEPLDADEPQESVARLLDDLDCISPYLPPQLLVRILAAPERPQLEADLRPVTPLFAQVVGLELMAESLPPELAARAAGQYIGAMQEAVAGFGGMVNKLDVADEGIKLVAVFGAPAAYEDHAERAARAALAMQAALADVNRAIAALARGPLPVLRQRIGINVGTAFAGNVGSAARKEYTVMGDAVNVAARVMSAAAWGEVWCSEATARAVGGRLRSEARGAVALKGKAQPLALFRLAGEPEDEAAGGVLASYRDMGPLVGRGQELAALQDHLRAALAGEGHALRIIGEAGVGKSRLAAALVEEALAAGARVVPAASFFYTAAAPYAAWGEWLKALCGIAAGDGTEQRAARLTARLAALGGGAEEWLPLLADLVRLDVPDNRLTRGLDPQLRQERRFALLQDLLLRAADEAPLVALFEDLHWADPISLDLWRQVAGALGGRRALLLGVHRPAASLPRRPGEHTLELGELAAAESDRLIAALAGAELPAEVRRQIAERAGGNPLFLAELLRAVRDRVPLPEGEGDAAPQPAYALQSTIDELPDSLNGLLLSRIDRLDEASRGVLRVGAVIGQRIPFGVLQSIQGADRRALVRQLTRLDEETLTVLERTEPERVHIFRHALVQEVTYQSMLYARRRELHGRIGAYLERRHAESLDDYVGLLAHHYRLSDRREKAVEYLLKAGHAARDVYANEEAMRSYQWALEALGGDEADPRAWETHDALGDVYATVGRYDEALAQHAAVLAAPGVTPEAARRAHRKRGNVLEKQGEYQQALAELERAMAIATSGAPGISPLAVPTICADIGLVRKRRAEYDLAIAACEQGLGALRTDPRTRQDELIEARLHSELGTIFGMRGDYQQARHHIERSLGAREAIDDLPGMVASHNNLGYLWQLQGEHGRAIGHYRTAEDLARKINLRYALIHAATNAAYALTSLGDYPAAEARCREALAIARELSAQQTIAQIQNTLGFIFYRTGAYDEALAVYDEALRINRALGSSHDEANARMHQAQVLAALGRSDEAQAAAEEALAAADGLQAQALRLETLNVLAEVALGQGRPEQAAALAAEALALAETIGSEDDAGVAQRAAGQAAAALGRPPDAHFAASVARFEHTGDRFELGRSLAAYGEALARAGNHDAGPAYLIRARDAFMAIGAVGELRRLAPVLDLPERSE